MYCIAKETVNNALRHAQANELLISLKQLGGQLILEVSDNGVGVEATKIRSFRSGVDQGMGPRIMEHLAGMIGGTLQIARGNPSGTTISMCDLGERMMKSPQAVPTTIAIVDAPMMREGLTMRLSPLSGWEVCGEAASDEEAMALIGQIKPVLALIDTSLKCGNGIGLVKRIKSRHPLVKMLVISGFEESLYGERALRVGAMGYLNKQVSNENLLEAVRTVLSGKRFISAALAQRLVGQAAGDVERVKTSIERLSDREHEVYRTIGQGLSTGTIAEKLFISPHTIDTHRENIKRQLALANTNPSELTRTVAQWGVGKQLSFRWRAYVFP